MTVVVVGGHQRAIGDDDLGDAVVDAPDFPVVRAQRAMGRVLLGVGGEGPVSVEAFERGPAQHIGDAELCPGVVVRAPPGGVSEAGWDVDEDRGDLGPADQDLGGVGHMASPWASGPGVGQCVHEPRPRWGRTGSLDRRCRVVLDTFAHLAGACSTGEALDQVQGHVDPGRDPGRGDDLAVVDEPFGVLHPDRRVEFGE